MPTAHIGSSDSVTQGLPHSTLYPLCSQHDHTVGLAGFSSKRITFV